MITARAVLFALTPLMACGSLCAAPMWQEASAPTDEVRNELQSQARDRQLDGPEEAGARSRESAPHQSGSARQSYRAILRDKMIAEQMNNNGIPARVAEAKGLMWTNDGARPQLEYRFDSSTSMRLRSMRRGARVTWVKEFN